MSENPLLSALDAIGAKRRAVRRGRGSWVGRPVGEWWGLGDSTLGAGPSGVCSVLPPSSGYASSSLVCSLLEPVYTFPVPMWLH